MQLGRIERLVFAAIQGVPVDQNEVHVWPSVRQLPRKWQTGTGSTPRFADWTINGRMRNYIDRIVALENQRLVSRCRIGGGSRSCGQHGYTGKLAQQGNHWAMHGTGS